MSAHLLSRRDLLTAGGALVASAAIPRVAVATNRDPRFLFVFLRGGLDGLAAVAPVGDPDYEAARGGLELARDGDGAGLPLDGTFVLNRSMPFLGALFRKGEAAIVHAVASPYRGRSHFDGQDVVETGLAGVGRIDTGWMNRMVGVLGSAERIGTPGGLAIGTSLPILMRGPAPVVTWLPPGYPSVTDDLRSRLLDLYREVDPGLATRYEAALALNRSVGGEASVDRVVVEAMKASAPRGAAAFRSSGLAAGTLMSRPDGPRIATMSFGGWDTHADEGPVTGALARNLESLDAALEGLAQAMAPVWHDTVIVVATEFGRTVRMNGTAGSDHGTASVAFLVGGRVKGGRVIADWPGLAQSALHEKRDLRPTTDLRALIGGVALEHLGLDERRLADVVFPESTAAAPLRGLIA